MPAKKKGNPATRKTSASSNVAAGQVARLRKTIATLETRLKRELGVSKLNQKMVAQTKKAHAAALKAAKDLKARFEKDRKALADRAAKVAADLKRRGDELKAAVTNSDRVKKAHDAAQKAADDLKARFEKEKSGLESRLTSATAEVKRKTEELKKLAEESIHRAREIVRGEPDIDEERPPREADDEETPGIDTDDDDPFDRSDGY